MRIIDRLHMLHRAWRYRLRAERQEIRYLFQQDLRGATVVDIGANRGIYSYWMHRRVGPLGHVVAFEPQPELVAWLAQVQQGFCLERLQIVPKALSSAPGEGTLVRPEKHWGGASLQICPAPGREAIHISLTTLDDFFLEANSKHGPVRFIKCDVEGHEDDVFQGGQKLLRRDRPDLIIESSDLTVQRGRLFPLLQSLGYEGYLFFRGSLVPLSRYRECLSKVRDPYFNFLFTAKNHIGQAA